VLAWLSVWSEVQTCIWPSWCHCRPKTPSSLASFESRLVLPFWYRLTQVVLEKRPLNGCCSNGSYKKNNAGSNTVKLYKTVVEGGIRAKKNSLPHSTIKREYRLSQLNYELWTSVACELWWTQTDRHTDTRPWHIKYISQLSTGPFCVIRSSPTHELTDPTQPNQLQVETFESNPTHNTTNKFNCLVQPNLSKRALNALT